MQTNNSTMLLCDHFSVKNNIFKLELFVVSFTYLISSSQNFFTFHQKLTKLQRKVFFAGTEIFTIVSNVFEHALN